MLNSNFYLQYKNDLINFSKNKFNMELNLNNPLKLTDKINWLKIYDNTVLKSYCADKILLHNFIIQLYFLITFSQSLIQCLLCHK